MEMWCEQRGWWWWDEMIARRSEPAARFITDATPVLVESLFDANSWLFWLDYVLIRRIATPTSSTRTK
jgi:hypothetical protein